MLARRRWRSGYNAGGGPNHMGEQRKHGDRCDGVGGGGGDGGGDGHVDL